MARESAVESGAIATATSERDPLVASGDHQNVKSPKSPSSVEPEEVSRAMAIQLCLFYALTSTVLAFVNKMVLTTYNFDCVFTLLLGQRVVCLIYTSVASHVGWLDDFGALVPSWTFLARYHNWLCHGRLLC